MFDLTIRHGDGEKARPGTAGRAVLRGRTGRGAWTSVLRTAEPGAGTSGVRCFLRTGVREVLSLEIGTAVDGARRILPDAADRILRRHRQRAGNRVARL